MHFQYPPKSEMKLFQCIKGGVFDVLVDIRKGSSTFLSWIGIELSPDIGKMVVIPEGCAHGFQAMTNDVEVLYFTTEFYAPDYEGGVRFDDPKIGIQWPLRATGVSERDMNHPFLSDTFKGI
jgi:dTDP-4-dehydrorhamnose 3,5-epimerase and related enzymes